MGSKTISSVLLFVAMSGRVFSFAISPMSCEFYNATCVKEALLNKEKDASEVNNFKPSSQKLWSPCNQLQNDDVWIQEKE